MTKPKNKLIWLGIIFALALFLRLYKLSDYPVGFHVDEVKSGWNAYSLLKTGRDDWLHAFPLHYDTFGDQRPTGMFYAQTPALAVFGLNVFAVRFTSALFGSLAVIAVYFLVLHITHNPKLSTLAALMAAISPWHISISRATSEGIIASTLILFGLIFLLRIKKGNWIDFFLSLTFLSVSYLFYHSARLLVPLFVFSAMIFGLSFKKLLLFTLTLTLTFAFVLSPTARSRLNQVSIFKDDGVRDELDRLPFEEGPNKVFITRLFHNKLVIYTVKFIDQYIGYFSPKYFLTFTESKPLRYATVLHGPLMYSEFILFVFGLFWLFQPRATSYKLLAIFLLLSPLPAAITTEDAPNLHRALLMSPFISILAGFGLYQITKMQRKFKYLYPLFLIILVLNFIYFSHLYLVHNSGREVLAMSRNNGVEKLFTKLASLQNRYSQIIFTNRPDSLYPWYAFGSKQDPRQFNSLLADHKKSDFTFKDITFSQLRCPSVILRDQPKPSVLAVDAEGCIAPSDMQIVDTVVRSSGGTVYTLVTNSKIIPIPQ